MIRKLIAALAVSSAALVITAAPAMAYVPPPVVSNTVITVLPTNAHVTSVPPAHPTPKTHTSRTAGIQVLPTSQSVQTTAAGSLSYTGVSFNVPLTITIAALVVLAGFALIFFGGRGLARGTKRAH